MAMMTACVKSSLIGCRHLFSRWCPPRSSVRVLGIETGGGIPLKQTAPQPIARHHEDDDQAVEGQDQCGRHLHGARASLLQALVELRDIALDDRHCEQLSHCLAKRPPEAPAARPVRKCRPVRTG